MCSLACGCPVALLPFLWSKCLSLWRYHTVLTTLCAQSLSHVQLFVPPWTVACQTPLSMGFSQQEYWSGLPFPTPGDTPDPGINPVSPASLLHWQANSLLLSHWRGPLDYSSFALSFEITKYKFSNFVLLSQDCISDSESFAFRNKSHNQIVNFRKKKKNCKLELWYGLQWVCKSVWGELPS